MRSLKTRRVALKPVLAIRHLVMKNSKDGSVKVKIELLELGLEAGLFPVLSPWPAGPRDTSGQASL